MTDIIHPTRRGFLLGLGAALVAGPAIVRAGSLMPVKSLPLTLQGVPIEFDLPAGSYWAGPEEISRWVIRSKIPRLWDEVRLGLNLTPDIIQ